MKVYKEQEVVLEGVKGQNNNLYVLSGRAQSVEAAVVEKVADKSIAELWHQRLGHISEKRLKELCKSDVLGGLKDPSLEFCEHCVYGKSHRVKFSAAKHNTVNRIDYVHLDLWGPSRVQSLGGARYFMSIIDDFTRRVWVIVLNSKNDAFGKFKEWKTLVENQTGNKVKTLRTDM